MNFSTAPPWRSSGRRGRRRSSRSGSRALPPGRASSDNGGEADESAKSTETIRRSVVGGGAAGAAAVDSSVTPQSRRTGPAGSLARRTRRTATTSSAPHWAQYRRPSRFSFPQASQRMPGSVEHGSSRALSRSRAPAAHRLAIDSSGLAPCDNRHVSTLGGDAPGADEPLWAADVVWHLLRSAGSRARRVRVPAAPQPAPDAATGTGRLLASTGAAVGRRSWPCSRWSGPRSGAQRSLDHAAHAARAAGVMSARRDPTRGPRCLTAQTPLVGAPLSAGDSGERVVELQTALAELGYYGSALLHWRLRPGHPCRRGQIPAVARPSGPRRFRPHDGDGDRGVLIRGAAGRDASDTLSGVVRRTLAAGDSRRPRPRQSGPPSIPPWLRSGEYGSVCLRRSPAVLHDVADQADSLDAPRARALRGILDANVRRFLVVGRHAGSRSPTMQRERRCRLSLLPRPWVSVPPAGVIRGAQRRREGGSLRRCSPHRRCHVGARGTRGWVRGLGVLFPFVAPTGGRQGSRRRPVPTPWRARAGCSATPGSPTRRGRPSPRYRPRTCARLQAERGSASTASAPC